MVNIVGFLQGIRESDDYWSKKSAEARDEYNRFVQSNPDSTVADRIERQKLLGGDMDYLRRLMPDEGNVTRNVGVQTQLRTDQQDQRNRAAASAGYAASAAKRAEEIYEYNKGQRYIQEAIDQNNLKESNFKAKNLESDHAQAEKASGQALLNSQLAGQRSSDALQKDARTSFFDQTYGTEEIPSYQEFVTFMQGQDKQGSFGSFLTKENYEAAVGDYRKARSLQADIVQRQKDSLDLNNAQAYEGQIVGLLDAGDDVNVKQTNDQIIEAMTAKSESFGNLGALAQNSVVDNAKLRHNEKVRANISSALGEWATTFNADPAKWSGPSGIGTQFDINKLSPENSNFIFSKVASLSAQTRTKETTAAKQQLVAQVLKATNEDQIASAKKAIEAQYNLLPQDKIDEVMAAVLEIEKNKTNEFEQKRNQAVIDLTVGFTQGIREGKFPNQEDLQTALTSELERVSQLGIPSQKLTKLETTLNDEFESDLSRRATEANEGEKNNVLAATAQDNASTTASFQTTGEVVETVKDVGTLISSSLAVNGKKLSEKDQTQLGSNLTSAYTKMSNLATELGIPLNKEFVEATLKDIAAGNHSDSLSIVSTGGVQESTLLDVMQQNLFMTYATSPSMRAYMEAVSARISSRDVSLSDLSQAQRIRIGQEWSAPGGAKSQYYERRFNVIPEEGYGAVGHPKHGGKRDAGFVLTVEDIAKDISVDVNISNQNVSDVLSAVNGIQAEASAWTDMYSGRNAKQPFSYIEKTEFSDSRAEIIDRLKRNSAAVKDLLIGDVENKEKISSQIQKGSFYQSQITNSNINVQRNVLSHISNLDRNIQQYQQLLSTLSSVNKKLIETEMDLEPRGVNEIRAKYPTEGEGVIVYEGQEMLSNAFNLIEQQITSVIDEAMMEGTDSNQVLLQVIENKMKHALKLGQAGQFGYRTNRLDQEQFDTVYRDALNVALSRRDVMEMQAEEYQMAP